MGRIPHGMRGLKSDGFVILDDLKSSHPAWDAWIEMPLMRAVSAFSLCRIPHGMRGLKL